MKVPDVIMTEWRRLRRRGEIGLIFEKTGISRVTIGHALNDGICSQKTLDAINEYFLSRPKNEESENREVSQALREVPE